MTEAFGTDTSEVIDAYWRQMRFFNLYRLIVAALLVAAHYLVHDPEWWQVYDYAPYFDWAVGYLVFAMVMIALTSSRQPQFSRQVMLQAVGDVSFIVILMHSAGGLKSGLGLLLVIAIVGAALVSQGRQALFYAALASIALLLEQGLQLVANSDRPDDFSQAAMLSLSCFATAWLAYALGQRMRQSEALASQRGIDLENLSQVNQLIIQDMQDGVLVVDEHLVLRHLNSQAEGLLGLDARASADMPLGQSAPDIARLLREWMKQPPNQRSDSTRLIIHGKELRLRFQPVGTDRRYGAVVFIEDWSRVQAQARQLKLAALGGLTANIAHEIRNPLSSISHAAQLLLEDAPQDPTLRRLLAIISDNSQRLDRIVQDVMQLNRRDRMQQERVTLAAFLTEFHAQFCEGEGIPPDGIAVVITQPDAAALFDRTQLHQVIWNLCRNGWRHGRKQAGSLQLRLDKAVRKGEIMLEITDDGPGVPVEIRQRLFEPFFTTENTGTGLGLYIARELCEANGAELRYIESPGGANFRIYLKNQHVQTK